MAKKTPRNPYGLQRVTPVEPKAKPKPLGPKPPNFKVGDVLHTGYKPHFFDLLQPIVALELREGISVCGWLVRVATNKGDQWLGASHFTRNPAPERGA
jgi:hypothetical protein